MFKEQSKPFALALLTSTLVGCGSSGGGDSQPAQTPQPELIEYTTNITPEGAEEYIFTKNEVNTITYIRTMNNYVVAVTMDETYMSDVDVSSIDYTYQPNNAVATGNGVTTPDVVSVVMTLNSKEYKNIIEYNDGTYTQHVESISYDPVAYESSARVVLTPQQQAIDLMTDEIQLYPAY